MAEEASQVEQQLLDTLIKPENLKTLAKILDALPSIEKLMEKLNELDRKGQLDTLLKGLNELVFIVDLLENGDLVQALVNFGMDQLNTVQALWPLLEKLQKMQESGVLEKLYNILDLLSDPKIVDKLNVIVSAVAKTATSEVKPASYTSVLTALRDKDIALALGFLLTLAKEMGKGLKQGSS